MGHQESFLRLKRKSKNEEEAFDKLIEIFRKYHIRTADDPICECCCKIVLKKNLTLGDFCDLPEEKIKAGSILLHVSGDRSAQREMYDFYCFDDIEYLATEVTFLNRFDLIFCEYVNEAQEIFDNPDYATVTELNLQSDAPKPEYFGIYDD